LDVAFCVIGSILVFHIIKRARHIPKGLRLPPGPRGRLIVGNLSDMPKQREWETFDRWAKQYGDLVHINVFGQSIVFVNSMEVAYDLLEKRSSLYSDRYEFPMVNELMGFDQWNWGLMRYGERWRRHRKMFYQKFQPSAVPAYYPIQTKQSRTLLRRLYDSPGDFITHFRHFAGATVMEVI